jgi:hypothetical protein
VTVMAQRQIGATRAAAGLPESRPTDQHTPWSMPMSRGRGALQYRAPGKSLVEVPWASNR